MLTLQEWRELLGQENLTDAEVSEFVENLRKFLGQFLDDYFRDEYAPDEV